MDNEVIKRGRKPNQVLNNYDLEKQQKRHQYYLNFKNKHGNSYYKKTNNCILGRPKKESTSIPETKNNIIDKIIIKLQELKLQLTINEG